jgi:hypothetical protein
MYTNFIIEFKERYFKLYGKDGPPKSTHVKGNKNLAKLLAEDTTDEEKPDTPILTDASNPWKSEFNRYLNGNDEVPNGMSLPRWWGVNSFILHINVCFQLIFYLSRSILRVSLSGLHWPVTFSRLWVPQFRASAHSHLLGSRSVNAGIA